MAALVLAARLRAADPAGGGHGAASLEPDPDRYDHCEAHCDVLVVGAGVTGLMAALEAGKDGARVIVADERPLLAACFCAGEKRSIACPRPSG